MLQKINIGINGFGRIGRNLCRLLINHPNINVVVINDLADAKTLSHLLKYDSIHGICNANINYVDNFIYINEHKITLLNTSKIEDINWTPYNIDYVVECTGKFKTTTLLQNHINNGAKKVILSVPPQSDDIKMVVMGVNENLLNGNEKII